MHRLRTMAMLFGCTLAAACSTTSGPQVSASSSCDDLNVAIAETSQGISTTAINRGRVGDVNVPRWLPVGARAQDALVARNTRQIDELKSRQEQAIAAYQSRCEG